MLRVDKIILAILAIEHLGFGIYGFYSPEGIAELTGYALNSEFAYSEIRAYYTLISGLGLMAFLAIFFAPRVLAIVVISFREIISPAFQLS